jgi:hypothetical protein
LPIAWPHAAPSPSSTSCIPDWPQAPAGIHFFRARLDEAMPAADRALLGALEGPGVPTVHNMILGDRVVSRLPYADVLGYATFLARRLRTLFEALKPDAVIVGFDAIHGGLALATARRLGLPAYAMHFSVLPPGYAGFCDRMSPAAAVTLSEPPAEALRALAARTREQFLQRSLQARAYIAPPSASPLQFLSRLPALLSATRRTLQRRRVRQYLRFTDERNRYSVGSTLAYYLRRARNRRAVLREPMIDAPPATPYVLFGLHMQPESSIDVWAPFFSNQLWVIELLSRVIPPTHTLLVKIHKSDIANYSPGRLRQIRALPGVQLVAPFADARAFIEGADLLTLIQGTMGLEAALLGKPVIMLGDSALTEFPGVHAAGALRELPALVRKALGQPRPSDEAIVEGYARYLAPLLPASDNYWDKTRTEAEIDGYVALFCALRDYLARRGRAQQGADVAAPRGHDERVRMEI